MVINRLGLYQMVDSRFQAPASQLIDPLVIYHDVSANPKGSIVQIPYVTTDGKIWPQDTRLVWPVAYRQK